MFAPKFGCMVEMSRIKAKVNVSCFACWSEAGAWLLKGVSR
jgi:hypothetical protein